MSLSGALTSAVTGIDAQSIALGSISDNISNSQTVGYKRVETNFSTLLTVSNALVHEPGGVTSTPRYTNDLQGTVQQTGVDTNLAVSGSGMFAVSQSLGAANSGANSLPTFAADPLYTREGDFSLNQQGFLVNNGGYYLNGFVINQTTGAVQKNALVPIQLNQLKSNPLATANVTYSANLPTSPPANLNIGSTTAITTTGAQTLTYPAGASPFANGETMQITRGPAGATTTTFVFSDTSAGVPATAAAGQVLIPFNSTTTPLGSSQIAAVATAMSTVAGGIPTSVDASGNLVVGAATALTTLTTNNITAAPVLAIAGAVPTSIAATVIPANLQFAATTVSIFDAQGAAHAINVNWTKISGTNDTYSVTYTSTDPAITGITPTAPTLVQFNVNNNAATGEAAGSIASINGVPGAAGTAISIPLTVSYGGNTPTTQSVGFSLGTYGIASQTTMFTGTDVNFISAQQDGLPPGSFRDLSIDTHGNITLNFDNGARKTEFQVPLVQFSNFDGLQPRNGNAYSTTVESGTPSVNSPGDNGTGTIVASSVEGSNVDIASEFTQLIQTQRAYEANTKVVTAVNQLLQETNQLVQ